MTDQPTPQTAKWCIDHGEYETKGHQPTPQTEARFRWADADLPGWDTDEGWDIRRDILRQREAQARTEALDVDALRRAMHIVLNSNRDAAWFVIGDDAPAYVAERIAIEYAAILKAKADR